MRYQAADGLSAEVINLDRNFGDVLVRAGLLKAAPSLTPKQPGAQVIDEEGVIHRAPMPDETKYSIGEHKNGAPFLQALLMRGGEVKATDFYSGPNPDNDISGRNWPKDIVADYRDRWKQYQSSLQQS